MHGSALALDHVGVALRSLDAAQAAYERLGFRLTPRSMHSGAVTPGGPVVPWGSGNHCAMFRRGYLELFGITDAGLYSSAKALLEKYEGAHIVAFAVADAEAARSAIMQRVDGIGPLRDFAREAAYSEAGESRTARFRTFATDKDAFPEARFVFVEHLTPEVLWQPHLLDHPNGAVGIDQVTLCVADPHATGQRLSSLLGTEPREGDGLLTYPLKVGHLSVATPDVLRRWGGLGPPHLPYVAGIGVGVIDLDTARALLRASGVPTKAVAAGQYASFWVPLEQAHGPVLSFIQSSL